MNLARHSIANRALVNAAMVLTLVVGLMALFAIPRELSPKVGFNWVFIEVLYPGANPEEVETLVVIPIEDAVETVDDIDIVTSRSRRGRGFVWVRFEQISEDDFERRMDDVRARLAKIDLPDEAEDPDVREFSSYDFEPVVSVVIQGQAPERQLHLLATDLERDLRDVPGIDDVEPFGKRDRALLVECDPDRLEAHRLDITDVETALRLANLNLPAGVIALGGEEFVLRTRSELGAGSEDTTALASELAAVTLRAGPEGARIRLGDVATVRDGFEDRVVASRFDDLPSITLSITKQVDGNTIEIVDGVRAVVESWQSRLPTGVELKVTNDQAVRIGAILGVLESNALLGMLLVVVALWLFIGWQGALVAALGIPVTFLIAIAAMHWTGQSLNANTLFGLILVLGMVVDDAVVVLENAFRHLEMGKARAQAVVDGVGQVMSPVVVSSLTTMGGFLPLVLMPGTTGKFMRIVPIVVSLVLVASLIESLWILPSHFVDIVRTPPKKHSSGSRWWEKLYLAVLRRFLPARYLVVVGSIVLLIGTVLLIPLVGIDLFGAEEISTVGIYVEMPDGTRLERTEEVLRTIGLRAMDLDSVVDESVLDGVTINAGLHQGSDEWQIKPHVGQVMVDVVEPQHRRTELDALVDLLRRETSDVPGPVKLELKKLTAGPPQEPAIQVLVKGDDLDAVAVASQRLEDWLDQQPGVLDVQDDLALTQRELDVVVDREAAARRGLDPTRIARAVRAAFGGHAATTVRQGDDELDVLVRYPEVYRNSLAQVRSMRFVNPMGDVVPFSEVARLEEGRGPQTIRRHDGERLVTIKANVDSAVTDFGAVNRGLFDYFERIRDTHPGIHLEPGGQFKEFLESFNHLARLFAIGMLINFMLMAGQFKNWIQPLLIMAVVPLSFLGAMLGLLISGDPFSIATLYGFVALAGVAVNDSIVLVDFINQARRRGLGLTESLVEAGRVRLRPILLTSVTTILGLLPMALGLGGASDVWQPLAITIAAGLAIATVISLLVIPCLQAIVDDGTRLVRRWFGWGASPEPTVEAEAMT